MLSYIICSVPYYWLYDSESQHGPIIWGGYSDKKAQDGLVKFQAAKTSSSSI